MYFSVKSSNPATEISDCLIIGIFESEQFTHAAKICDQASKGYISKLLKRGDITGKQGQTLLLHNIPRLAAERVLLIGCGKKSELTAQQFRKIVSKAMSIVNSAAIHKTACYLTELIIKSYDNYWKVRQIVELAEDVTYRFDQFKRQTEKSKLEKKLTDMLISVNSKDELLSGKHAIRDGLAIAAGVRLFKDLGNLPANICTPTYLAQQAEKLAKTTKQLTTKIYEVADLKKLGMGAFLAVAKGSTQPAKLITLQYRGAKSTNKPIVLVGKGITFDSGGISIKQSAGMDEMKYDMCGAATVLGVFAAVSALNLPINLVGVIAATENMPDGQATKPGDIVTTLSGQTVEILNTDAEGRLILCDALTFSERFNPEVVIDIATLTGAVIIALGNQAAALLSNYEPLAKDLLKASNYSGDRLWQLPLWEEYQEALTSNFADMANIGDRQAGCITAASFLARFTKQFHWAHLDIAGVAWRSGKDKGATGRPVPLLMQYLLDYCAG